MVDALADNTDIIGADIELDEAHQLGVDETGDHSRKMGTTKNYQNWIQHMYAFMEMAYPEYCNCGGV